MSGPIRLVEIDEVEAVFPTHAAEFEQLSARTPPVELREAVLHWPGGGRGLGVSHASAEVVSHSGLRDEFLARMKENWSVVDLFQALLRVVPPEHQHAVSAAVESSYWASYGAVLIHPLVSALVAKLGEHDDGQVLYLANYTGWRLQGAPMGKWARLEHRLGRLGMLKTGRQGTPDAAVAAGEFLVDYLYMQRAIAEDVRRASRTRARGESTAARLDRLVSRNSNRDEAWQYLSDPRSIAEEFAVSDQRTMDDLIAYGRARRFPEEGVLGRLAGEGLALEPLPADSSAEGI
jgi:hypothetical protein